MKEKGTMHLNIRKTCISWYTNEADGDDAAPDEDGSGNV